ncbi:queuosine precursor transporter [Consotaella aegiceratis]|uniref:queuosine precursor transporter n=1 Tax=Consotaella aegiceratis TaxID=3097961 RepID=UPI002F40DC17
MSSTRRYLPAVLAMTLIVVASNVLVQFPVGGSIGSLQLADILTWGAFTYPFSFLVTDLTNRRFGPRIARRVVLVGFLAAVVCSIVVPKLLFSLGLMDFATAADRLMRIALASGCAFLAAQLLDITIFNGLRRQAWWRAPVISSVAGTVVDTAIFFTISFAPAFAFLGPNDDFSLGTAPLFGVLSVETVRWVSWALGDLGIKLVIAALALVPYRIIMQALMPYPVPARS